MALVTVSSGAPSEAGASGAVAVRNEAGRWRRGLAAAVLLSDSLFTLIGLPLGIGVSDQQKNARAGRGARGADSECHERLWLCVNDVNVALRTSWTEEGCVGCGGR